MKIKSDKSIRCKTFEYINVVLIPIFLACGLLKQISLCLWPLITSCDFSFFHLMYVSQEISKNIWEWSFYFTFNYLVTSLRSVFGLDGNRVVWRIHTRLFYPAAHAIICCLYKKLTQFKSIRPDCLWLCKYNEGCGLVPEYSQKTFNVLNNCKTWESENYTM